MNQQRESLNLSCAHGEWGEDVAVEYLRRHGYEIIERNSRPVKRDLRLEIDVVAWDRKSDVLVFVEVKQHSRMTEYASRLQSVNLRKRLLLKRACNHWRRINRWQGGYRFDVIEIYGVPDGGRPVVDHITHVDLFVKKDRFVKWE